MFLVAAARRCCCCCCSACLASREFSGRELLAPLLCWAQRRQKFALIRSSDSHSRAAATRRENKHLARLRFDGARRAAHRHKPDARNTHTIRAQLLLASAVAPLLLMSLARELAASAAAGLVLRDCQLCCQRIRRCRRVSRRWRTRLCSARQRKWQPPPAGRRASARTGRRTCARRRRTRDGSRALRLRTQLVLLRRRRRYHLCCRTASGASSASIDIKVDDARNICSRVSLPLAPLTRVAQVTAAAAPK